MKSLPCQRLTFPAKDVRLRMLTGTPLTGSDLTSLLKTDDASLSALSLTRSGGCARGAIEIARKLGVGRASVYRVLVGIDQHSPLRLQASQVRQSSGPVSEWAAMCRPRHAKCAMHGPMQHSKQRPLITFLKRSDVTNWQTETELLDTGE
jgi:hypothetical protein